MRPAIVSALVVLWLPLAGCGYTFVGGYGDDSGEADASAQIIAIRMFENRSVEPGLERMLADAFHEEFLRRGSLRTRLGAASGSDIELDGVIQEVAVASSALSSVALTLEDRVAIVLDLAIRRPGDPEDILRHRGLRYEERFLASADPQVYESNKEQALRRLCSGLASRIHDELDRVR